ncbi:hydroxyacid dehydrogenase [Paenibacillus hodogayensis]|uniref:hydroxyacid dehydrogenase n=1 Tax=Paenibacillus hodogayensis TaxID=279208 RepID=UPI0031F15ECA
MFDQAFHDWSKANLEWVPLVIDRDNAEAHRDALRDVEVAFSTWGMPLFTEEELESYFPSLRIVFYAAGTVQAFARPFLARSIRVVSAWAANAIPVAEYTVAQIVLANKGFYQASRHYKQSFGTARETSERYPGNFGARVGILGAGMIGRNVIERLRAYELTIDVFDPFLSEERASEMGVVKAELVELFARCDTISNHLANLPATVGILHKEHFDRMLPHATFINTGRGAQVVEEDLIRALREVPTRTALLDVTHPEPVREDSELLRLDNVVLTPHIAGSISREVARMGRYMAEECGRYLKGEPLRYEVKVEMLETMA